MFPEILSIYDETVKVFAAVSGAFVGQGRFKGSSSRLRDAESLDWGGRIEGVSFDIGLVKGSEALRLEFDDGAIGTVLPRHSDKRRGFIVVQGIENPPRTE